MRRATRLIVITAVAPVLAVLTPTAAGAAPATQVAVTYATATANAKDRKSVV